MSACISSHGEYSEHHLDASGECEWCGVFTADTVRRATLESIDVDDLARMLYELAWQPGPVGVPWEALAKNGPNRRKCRERAEAVKAHLLAEVPTTPGRTASSDVAAERARQDAKWGEQNHPDGTGPAVRPLAALVANAHAHASASWLAERATSLTDTAANVGTVTWRHILLEEVFEALAEDDPEKLRAELVQVAAVAESWVEAVDRRGGAS